MVWLVTYILTLYNIYQQSQNSRSRKNTTNFEYC